MRNQSLKDIFWFRRTPLDGWEYLILTIVAWVPFGLASYFSESESLYGAYFIWSSEGIQFLFDSWDSVTFLEFPFYMLGIWVSSSLTYRRAAQFSKHPLALLFGTLGLLFGNAPGSRKSSINN